jgi:hypothetical protein
VQLEDKLVDGREAAHAESQQRADVLEHGNDTLPAPLVEALHDAALERRGQLLGAIRMILDRQTLVVSHLHLPQREARALEALQVAVSGKSRDLGQFVYATDRRDMLEQALAVLQPDLTHANDQAAHELHAQFVDLTERVAELRHALTELEDSQDELREKHQKAAIEEAATEPGDKPKPSDPDAPRPPTTLVGPDRPEPERPTTTLVGPDLPPEPAPTSTLAGPDLPEPARPMTTLVGPDLPEPARPPTTLVGPDLPPEPAPTSTLAGPEATAEGPPGDAEEGATKTKRPWWRRPFG